MTKTIVAVISDTHIGSTTALAPPEFTIHGSRPNEAQTCQHNCAQRWLWECWENYWQYVRKLVYEGGKKKKNRLVVIHLGDVIDGLHHHTPQVMNEPSDQIGCAIQILTPIADFADRMFLCYGTDSHNGGAGAFEIPIANALGIEHGWTHDLDINGVTINCAHHGRASQRDWTSAAAGVVTEVAMDFAKRGKVPPRFILRGHNHVIDDSGEKNELTRVVSLPSWQLRTAYGYRVAANKARSDIGGLVIVDGQIDFTRARYKAAPGQCNEVKITW